MTAVMIDLSVPPSTSASSCPSALHRVKRRAIWATAVSVVISLAVLLQMLPGADASIDASEWATSTTLLFVGGAVAALATIGVMLVRATRRSGS